MAATPETGFLVIADLTGYTAYLSGSELEHAPAIAGDLLETIVGRLDPPFRLAKFEGDAAFLWVEDGARGWAAARRRPRGVVSRLSPPPAEHRPGNRAATATRAGWRRGSTSSCSSTTARTSRRRSRAAKSSPGPTSSSSIACSREPGLLRRRGKWLRALHRAGRQGARARCRRAGPDPGRGDRSSTWRCVDVHARSRGSLAGRERTAPPRHRRH